MYREGAPYYLEVTWDKASGQIAPLSADNSQIPDRMQPSAPMENPADENATHKKGEERTNDVGTGNLHPYPLPALPKMSEEQKGQAENSTYSTINELWNYPQPEWPECKREFRFKINLNPLGFRRKTICCLIVTAIVVALLIGLTVTIFVLMERIKSGEIIA